jgi:hypothetical protein
LPALDPVVILKGERWKIEEVPPFEPDFGTPKTSPNFKPAIEGAMVTVFRDDNNYAGSVIKELGPREMPMSAPEAFVVANGVLDQLGYGEVKYWSPDGNFVLEVPVDGSSKPSGYEFTTDRITRVVSHNAEWRVKNYTFLGASRLGIVYLGSVRSFVAKNEAELYSSIPDATSLLRCLEGFIGHWSLPEGWAGVAVAPSGWVLARRVSARILTEADITGKTPDQLFKERSMQSQDDLLWQFAWFNDGALTPIEFERPKGTESYRWTGDVRFTADEAFEFTAIDQMDVRAFRLSRR